MTKILHYDYTESYQYCEDIGLHWLGDDFLIEADKDAFLTGFTQNQVDVAMRHHLWQVRHLFNPKSYKWYQRILLAFHFIFGRMKG